MKKLLLLICPFAFSIFMNAQSVPNQGMENWTNIQAYDDPDGWATFNFLSDLSLGGNPVSVFKDSVNPHSGLYSSKIESVNITTNPFPQVIPDTVGLMFTGAINLTSLNVTLGYAYAARPMSLTWWYHYLPMNAGDSGYVIGALTHWNTSTSSRDTLATAMYSIHSATAWTMGSTNFYYSPSYPNTLSPDTALIVFSATDDTYPKVGSTLWVDDIGFAGWVGVNEFANDNSVSVFPNPSSTTTNFEINDQNAFEIAVYDLTGREIKRQQIVSNKVSVDSYTLAPGIYTYSVLSKDNSVLSHGKFEVTQ